VIWTRNLVACRHIGVWLALAALLVGGAGCRRRPTVVPEKIFVPPPPAPRQEAAARPLPAPPPYPAGRALVPAVPEEPPEGIRSQPEVPPYEEPPPPRTADGAASGQPALQLGALLAPEEERRYRDRLQADLARVRRNLGRLARRNLTGRQADEVRRIRALARQAEALRGQDLVAASELAGRAVILSEELLRTTR